MFWSTTEMIQKNLKMANLYVCALLDSLFKDVLCVHPSVVFGQFGGEDHAGDQEDTAASQSKPEYVLKKTGTSKSSHLSQVHHVYLFKVCCTHLNILWNYYDLLIHL